MQSIAGLAKTSRSSRRIVSGEPSSREARLMHSSVLTMAIGFSHAQRAPARSSLCLLSNVCCPSPVVERPLETLPAPALSKQLSMLAVTHGTERSLLDPKAIPAQACHGRGYCLVSPDSFGHSPEQALLAPAASSNVPCCPFWKTTQPILWLIKATGFNMRASGVAFESRLRNQSRPRIPKSTINADRS